MEFKIGEVWETRDGGKAIIVEEYNGIDWGVCYIFSCKSLGKFHENGKSTFHKNYDLIRPSVKPIKADLSATVYQDEDSFFISDASTRPTIFGQEIATIKIKYEQGKTLYGPVEPSQCE